MGHKLEHRNKEGKVQFSSSLKLAGLVFDIWYVASPCGPLPNFHMMPPGVKTDPALGVTSWNIRTKKPHLLVNFIILLL